MSTRILAARAFLLALAAMLYGCGSATAERPAFVYDRDAIKGELQNRLRRRSPHYADLTLEAVEFSPGLTTMCGRIVAPGRTPHFFISTDLPNDHRRRSVSGPLLFAEGSWDHPSNYRLSELALERCHEMGLLR
ncbi:hypothetical protein [Brevundimonas sp.]|uniref:hypothetical protein n=1 Tax=Brevundimonas sp. TaxID=1871086 RepID=UPI002ED7EE9D